MLHLAPTSIYAYRCACNTFECKCIIEKDLRFLVSVEDDRRVVFDFRSFFLWVERGSGEKGSN